MGLYNKGGVEKKVNQYNVIIKSIDYEAFNELLFFNLNSLRKIVFMLLLLCLLACFGFRVVTSRSTSTSVRVVKARCPCVSCCVLHESCAFFKLLRFGFMNFLRIFRIPVILFFHGP